MVGLIIGFAFYMMASTGTFGGDLVSALGSMGTWYGFWLILASIIAIGIIVIGVVGGGAWGADQGGGKAGVVMGMIIGAMGSGLFAALIVFRLVVTYYTVTWLGENIDPAIVDFSGLETKETIGLGFLIFLGIMGMFKSNKNSSD